MAATKNRSSYRVHGWEHGQDSYESPEAASKDYKDWSGGFTPEEDGLKVISNKNHKRLNGMQKEDLDESTFSDSEHLGQSNFDKFKKGSKEHEFHYDPKEQITTVHMKKDGKHISTFNHKTGEIFWDKHPASQKNEALTVKYRESEDDAASADLDAKVDKHNSHIMKCANAPRGPKRVPDTKHKDYMHAVPTGYKETPMGRYISMELDKPSKHESIELINAINSGDTLASAQLFNDALMSKVSELIDTRRQEIAQSMFTESTKNDYHEAVDLTDKDNKRYNPSENKHNVIGVFKKLPKSEYEIKHGQGSTPKYDNIIHHIPTGHQIGVNSTVNPRGTDIVHTAVDHDSGFVIGDKYTHEGLANMIHKYVKSNHKNESIELDEIKSNKNSYGVVDTENSKYTHTDLTTEKARAKAQELNVAHFGHQKPTGAGTDIPKRYAKVLHLPGRKVGEKYAGDLDILKNSM